MMMDQATVTVTRDRARPWRLSAAPRPPGPGTGIVTTRTTGTRTRQPQPGLSLRRRLGGRRPKHKRPAGSPPAVRRRSGGTRARRLSVALSQSTCTVTVSDRQLEGCRRAPGRRRRRSQRPAYYVIPILDRGLCDRRGSNSLNIRWLPAPGPARPAVPLEPVRFPPPAQAEPGAARQPILDDIISS